MLKMALLFLRDGFPLISIEKRNCRYISRIDLKTLLVQQTAFALGQLYNQTLSFQVSANSMRAQNSCCLFLSAIQENVAGRFFFKLHHTIKKGQRFSRPQPGCHIPNSPWPGIIKLFPARESQVSDIAFGRDSANINSITRRTYFTKDQITDSSYEHNCYFLLLLLQPGIRILVAISEVEKLLIKLLLNTLLYVCCTFVLFNLQKSPQAARDSVSKDA